MRVRIGALFLQKTYKIRGLAFSTSTRLILQRYRPFEVKLTYLISSN